MKTKKKICFVIMGFGKKTDYEAGKTIDLNKTYENIIKPSVIESGYHCVRADEIRDSGLIDKSMYILLAHADLVIADISTYNPNAIYELGIRHALRPFSTIILKENREGKIPFDLDHTRMFMYKHEGDGIFSDEVNRCKKELTGLIKIIDKSKQVDSPMYEYLKITPPKIKEDELNTIMTELAEKSENVFAKVAMAEQLKSNKNFSKASDYWKKASELAPNESYFIQQEALCKYKSDESSLVNLTDAITIINKLDPDTTNDPETLGITGAIYKQIFLLSKDMDSLNRAIKYYERGYMVGNSHYPGENYATCLELKSKEIKDEDEKNYLTYSAKKTRLEIVETLNKKLELAELESRNNIMWAYATLANCSFHLNKKKEAHEYEELFKGMNPEEWELETYYKNKKEE